MKVWEVSTGKCQSTLTGHSDTVRGVCFSPDGSKIASCSVDKTIRMWNAQTGENWVDRILTTQIFGFPLSYRPILPDDLHRRFYVKIRL